MLRLIRPPRSARVVMVICGFLGGHLLGSGIHPASAQRPLGQLDPPATTEPPQSPPAGAQTAPVDPQAPAAATPSAQRPRRERGQKADEALQFRIETITTRDGVPLACGYFPSDRGKEAVPVIIIHEWKGQAPTYVPLAQALNQAGCAVFTIDLRGHGASRTYVDPRGASRQFDLSRFRRGDIQAMLAGDLEAVKRFAKEENDAERLNLNALTLVGFGEGGILASNYATIDWNFPDIGGSKQSKDVRGLVIVSPTRVLQGFTMDVGLRHPLVSRLPWLIMAGASSPEAEEAEKIHKQLERIRRGNPAAGPAELVLLPTGASNVRLIRESKEAIPRIVDFVKTNVIDVQERFPWISRAD